MIRFFLLLLACIAGTWYLVDTIKQNGPGYVLIAYNDYTLETSFWLALVIMIALVTLIYGAIRLSVILFLYSIKLGLLPETYSRKRAIKLENTGTQAFLDQHWSMAGTHLVKAAKNSATPFIDHIMAARAYIASANFSEAEQCLQQAKSLSDADPFSLSLLEFDIVAAKNDPQKTNTLLQNLLDSSSNKAPVLVRAITHYSNTDNWQALEQWLPKIKKQKLLTDEAFLQLQATTTVGLMQSTDSKLTEHQLKTFWKSAAKVHHKPEVIQAYCAALLNIGETRDVEKLIKYQLRDTWDEKLVRLYGQIKTSHPAKQLAFLEGFLPKHKDSAALQLSLSQLAVSSQLTGKAKDYLEHSLQIAPSVEAYKLLAEINEELHDENTAKHHLKLGLELAASQLSE